MRAYNAERDRDRQPGCRPNVNAPGYVAVSPAVYFRDGNDPNSGQLERSGLVDSDDPVQWLTEFFGPEGAGFGTVPYGAWLFPQLTAEALKRAQEMGGTHYVPRFGSWKGELLGHLLDWKACQALNAAFHRHTFRKAHANESRSWMMETKPNPRRHKVSRIINDGHAILSENKLGCIG